MRKFIIPFSSYYLPTSVRNAIKTQAESGSTYAKDVLDGDQNDGGTTTVNTPVDSTPVDNTPVSTPTVSNPVEPAPAVTPVIESNNTPTVQSVQSSSPVQQSVNDFVEELNEEGPQVFTLNKGEKPVKVDTSRVSKLDAMKNTLNTNSAKAKEHIYDSNAESSLRKMENNKDINTGTAEEIDLHDTDTLNGTVTVNTINKDDAKFAPNAVYQVHIVNASNIDEVQGDNIEVWYISDKNGFQTSALRPDSALIGAKNLEGAINSDYVIYNKDTHQLYQYAQQTDDVKDMHKEYASYVDKCNSIAVRANEHLAKYEEDKANLIDSLHRACELYGINLDNVDEEGRIVIPDEQGELIDVYIQKYMQLEADEELYIQNTDKRYNWFADKAAKLEEMYTENGTVMTVMEYEACKGVIQEYKDIQDVLSGNMTNIEFNAKYGYSHPTATQLNDAAVAAKNAQDKIDKCDGGLIDDVVTVYTDENGVTHTQSISDMYKDMANEVYNQKLSEEAYMQQMVHTAGMDYNMDDPKQVNTLIDVCRNWVVNDILDGTGGPIERAVKAVPALIKDIGELGKNVADTLMLTDEQDTLTTGLSGVILAHMKDAGDLFVAVPAALFKARGLRGSYKNYQTKDYYVVENYTHFFDEGSEYNRLNNADYYQSKATRFVDYDGSLSNKLHNTGAQLANTAVMLEAMLRGDIDSGLTLSNKGVYYNGDETWGKLEEQHPVALMAVDLMANIVLDPTTWIGLASGSKLDDVTEIKRLASEYSDNLADYLRTTTNMDEDDIVKFLDKFNAVFEEGVKDATKSGTRSIEPSKFYEALKGIEIPEYSFDDVGNMIINTATGEPIVINTIKAETMAAEATKYVAEATDYSALWKDAAHAVKSVELVKSIDEVCNWIQLGPIYGMKNVLSFTKDAFNSLKMIPGYADVTNSVRSGVHRILYTINSFLDKGVAGLSECNTLCRGIDSSTVLTVLEEYEKAIKVGDFDKAYTLLGTAEELRSMSANLRVDFTRSVMDSELREVGSVLQERIGLRDILKDGIKPGEPLMEKARRVTSYTYLTNDTLDNIIVTTSNGLHTSYKDYIASIRQVADMTDDIDALRSSKQLVEHYVKRYENIISAYNRRVAHNQCVLLSECVDQLGSSAGRAEAIGIMKCIDMSTIAPDLQGKFDECLNMLLSADIHNSDAVKAATDSVKATIKEYEKYVDKSLFGCTGHKFTGNIPVINTPYVTPNQYVDKLFEQAGVRPNPEDYERMLKKSLSDFKDDPELAGVIFEFVESHETNLNAMLNNTGLRKLLDDASFVDELKRIGVIDSPFDINLNNMEQAQFLLNTNFGNTRLYHAIMDTVAGSDFEINKYAREYARCVKQVDKDYVLDKCVDYIYDHVEEIQSRAQLGVHFEGSTTVNKNMIREAIDTLFTDADMGLCTVVPTRETVYGTLFQIDEKLTQLNADGAYTDLIKRIESVLDDGAYATNNNELGMLLNTGRVDEIVEAMSGTHQNLNNTRACMEFILNGESAQVTTILNIDRVKEFIAEDTVRKVMNRGVSVARELDQYVHDVHTIYDALDTYVDFTAEEIAHIKSTVVALCAGTTEPAELRYLEYFVNCTDSDSKKFYAALIDIQERFGIDERAMVDKVAVSIDPNIGSKLNEANKAKNFKGNTTHMIVNTENEDMAMYLNFSGELNNVSANATTAYNKYKLKYDLYDILYGAGDGEAKSRLTYRLEKARELNDVYFGINTIPNTVSSTRARARFRSNQIKTLRNIESDLWKYNVKRVTGMNGDILDRFLLTQHNAIVCDTVAYPELVPWLAAREAEGYVITHTEFGGTSVQILSKDFSSYTGEAIENLKNAHLEVDDTMSATVGYHMEKLEASSGDDYKAFVTSIRQAYDFNAQNLGDDWARSATGARHNTKWCAELRERLPQQCRLDGSLTSWANTHQYSANMLVPPTTARDWGAHRGHMLGGWFYAGSAALNDADAMDDMCRLVSSQSMSLGNAIQAYGDPELALRTLNDSNYHVIRIMSDGQAGDLTHTRIIDYTDTARKGLKRITKGGNLKPELASAVVVDDDMFKYLTGKVVSDNRAYWYATTPKAITYVADMMDSIRSAYITGMLYMSNVLGTGFRNIVDSNTKAFNEVGLNNFKSYISKWFRMVDDQNDYVNTIEKVYRETGLQGYAGLTAYIEKHIDDAGFDAQNLLRQHACYTMTGTADDDIAKVIQKAHNNQLLDSVGFALTEDEKARVWKVFNKVRDTHWLNKRKYSADSVKLIREELELQLKDTAVDADQVDELAKLYGKWIQGNTQHWYQKLFDADSTAGRILSLANKNTFDNAEVRARNAMMWTFLENGQTPSSANARVIKTQFDYGTSYGMMGGWDKIMPFAKYQFHNAAYWLDASNYSSFALSNMRRLSSVTHDWEDDPESASNIIKRQIAYAYIAKKYGSENAENYIDDANVDPLKYFTSMITGDIENYNGTNSEYANGIKLSNHKYIKIGNGFMDTLDWLGTVMKAPAEIVNGDVPTVLVDTGFAPAKTTIHIAKAVNAYLADPTNKDNALALKKFAGDNYYDVINLIPIFGNLANMCITNAKNITASTGYMALAMCSEGCQNSIVTSYADLITQVGGTLLGTFNSIIGSYYDKEIKKSFKPYVNEAGETVKWSTLTEDEKANYFYIPGYSDDWQWRTTPSKYYYKLGQFMDIGLTFEESKKLLDSTNWKNDYFYYSSNGKLYSDTRALKVVTQSMLEKGYTFDEICDLLTSTSSWYDIERGWIIHSSTELKRHYLNEAFMAQYELIPEYIRYDTEQYKRQMEYYKSLGYSTDEAWRLMRTSNLYIGVDALGHNVIKHFTDKEVKNYTEWMQQEYYANNEDDGFLEWYNTLPEYIRYEKGAYSRTLAYLKQMFDTDEAKAMIAGGAYYTPDGRLINCSELKRAPRLTTSAAFQDESGYWHDGSCQPWLGLGFQGYWDSLPNYLKYTKGAWSTANKVLKAAGLNERERLTLLQQGVMAVELDPNSEEFKQLIAQQKTKVVTTTVYEEKEVPLRECDWNGTEWIWKGPQEVKVTDLGNGYTYEQLTYSMQVYAEQSGLSKESNHIRDYDSAVVKVKVPKTVAFTVDDNDNIIGRIVECEGKSYYITDKLPEYSKDRGGYYNRNYVKRTYNPKKRTYKYDTRKAYYNRRNKFLNRKYGKARKYYAKKSYASMYRPKGSNYGYYNKPMTISHSLVRTYAKTHFLYQQGLGYQYWSKWGDGNITNHRNRNGRLTIAPSVYRNPLAKRRNMYRDLYGKYGASRMNQRQNIAGYVNGSITRLHRNEIRNRSYNIKQSHARIL